MAVLTGLPPLRRQCTGQRGAIGAGDIGPCGSGPGQRRFWGGRGRNFGWPQREGSLATAHLGAARPEAKTEPFLDWPRSDGRSVIGGFVYRGSALGGSGSNLFGDFSFGHVRSVRIRTSDSGEAQSMGIGETVLHTLPEKLNGLTAIEPDHAGEPVLVEMFTGEGLATGAALR